MVIPSRKIVRCCHSRHFQNRLKIFRHSHEKLLYVSENSCALAIKIEYERFCVQGRILVTLKVGPDKTVLGYISLLKREGSVVKSVTQHKFYCLPFCRRETSVEKLAEAPHPDPCC